MDNLFHQPQGGNEMPRFAGRATMMRLPFIEDLQGLDAAFVGIPLDIGTSQRSGTRYGPRYIRAESVMIRPYNMATGAAPFDSLSVADIGDVPINTYSLLKSVQIIEDYYTGLNSYPLIPLTLGGDHTITLPILRALTKKHGPVGLIHVDAHTDTNDEMFGEKIAHGTTFRRAVEEGLLDLKRVVQIGQRAQGYAAGDFQWGVDQGFRLVQAEQCWHTSLAPLMAEVRQQMGNDLNTSMGVTALYDALKAKTNDATKLAILDSYDQVLSLSLLEKADKVRQEQANAKTNASAGYAITGEGDPAVDAQVLARYQAKKAKNFAEADRIRDELKQQGIEITDVPGGAVWKRI